MTSCWTIEFYLAQESQVVTRGDEVLTYRSDRTGKQDWKPGGGTHSAPSTLESLSPTQSGTRVGLAWGQGWNISAVEGSAVAYWNHLGTSKSQHVTTRVCDLPVMLEFIELPVLVHSYGSCGKVSIIKFSIFVCLPLDFVHLLLHPEGNRSLKGLILGLCVKLVVWKSSLEAEILYTSWGTGWRNFKAVRENRFLQ